MRRIEFTVQGHLPPKKDGANSMWNKPSERARLIELRKAAYSQCGSDTPLSENIRLKVEIYCPLHELPQVGDFDNFITGVCDGLMAAAERTPVESWDSPELKPIHPSKPLAIRDDRNVVEIIARKLPSEDGNRWYRVVLEDT
jgi:hypothetical protein